MNEVEKYVGKSKMTGKPKKRFSFIIGNKAVTSDKIDDEAVTPEKVHPSVIDKMVKPLLTDLQNQVDSYSKHGIAVSNQFGSDPYIGISQKTLTEAFNAVWEKLAEITGESYNGIEMTVTPDYFISEDGCQVHITASSMAANGIFEHIAFYANGELITEAENTDYLEYDAQIDETTVIKCTAKIMGIEYTKEKAVTHYNSFWLGCGASYADIMDVEHVIPIANGMRGAYDVQAAENDRIIVVVGESLKKGFIRADINGAEIPFIESDITLDGVQYHVYTSENTYVAGTYNVDING